MAEAAAALSLATNIIQVIEVCFKIGRRLRDFTSANKKIPESLRTVSGLLPLLSDTLQQFLQQAEAGDFQKSVADVVQNLDGLLGSLNSILSKIVPKDGSSTLKKRVQALHSLRYDDKIKEHIGHIQSNINALMFHQNTSNSGMTRQLVQDVAKLNPTVAWTISGTQEFSFGMNLARAPQISQETFVGRALELLQLSELFDPWSTLSSQHIVSLVGLGGMGKTQLSLKYANQKSFLYSSIFWLNAKDELSLIQGLEGIGDVIRKAGTRAVTTEPSNIDTRVQEVRKWFSQEGNHRWLLIFDNYDDPDLPNIKSTTGFDIRNYFPFRAQGHILITTRSNHLTFSKQLKLKKLEDTSESVNILSSRAGRDLSQDPHVEKLVLRIDGLPLALATAGAYLSGTSQSCQEYLKEYDLSYSEMEEENEQLLEYGDRTLYSTWNLSLKQVRSQNNDVAKLFLLLAHFGNNDIWYELVRAAASDDLPWLQTLTATKRKFERAMSILVAYSLVEMASDSFGLHNCVHDWALMSAQYQTNSYTLLAVTRSIASLAKGPTEPEYWIMNQRLTNHAKRLENIKIQAELDHSILCMEQFSYFDKIGRLWATSQDLVRAENMHFRAIYGQMRRTNPLDQSILLSFFSLAETYLYHEKSAKAVEILENLMGSYQMANMPEDKFQQLRSRLALASFCAARHDRAKELYRGILSTEANSPVLDPSEVADGASYLGQMFAMEGDLENAEKFATQSLAEFEKIRDTQNPLRLRVMCELCEIYRKQERNDLLEQMLPRAQSSYVMLRNINDRRTWTAVSNLALVSYKCKKIDFAEEVCLRVAGFFDSNANLDGDVCLSTLITLTKIYQDQSRTFEAQSMCRRILEIWSASQGTEAAAVSFIRHAPDITGIMETQNMLEQAYNLCIEVLNVLKVHTGPVETGLVTFNTVDGVIFCEWVEEHMRQ